MRSRLYARVRVFVLAGLLLLTGTVSPAGAVGVQTAPVTTIEVDPVIPDGLAGWWLAAPDVSLTSDQTGTAYYSYGGAATPLALAAGVPAYLTDVPEGAYTLTAYSTNSGGETESPPATVALKVDSGPPSRPLSAAWDFVSGNTISLTWDASSDAASGVKSYAVYRNLTGAPFDPADLVEVVTGPAYDDTTFPPVTGLHYAIEAWDEAGNVSLLSDELVVDIDLIPPTTPGDLQAWINAGGWARVSWEPSFDAGSGLANYLVYRSVNGADFELVGAVPASATFFDDLDTSLGDAVSVQYDVIAVDRIGWESGSAGPVNAGRDVVPPLAPVFMVSPVWSGDSLANDSFLLDWSDSPGTDGGSGAVSYEIRYGTDPQSPTTSVWGGVESGAVPIAEDPSTLLYFSVRVQDAAGNIADSAVVAGRNVPVYNLAGADRIGTSLAASRAGFASADTVVFASAYNYPDALCAAPLAGKVGGPVLLAPRAALSAETVAELVRLGAANAYVIGGTAAISDETYASIDAALSGNVERVFGPTRYETAGMVLGELEIEPAETTRAYIVTGEKFPDALAVAPAGYAEGSPILYARADSVPDSVLNASAKLDIDSFVIVGGTSSVTPAADTLLVPSIRVSGSTRYATARAFADWALMDGVLVADSPCVATGTNFPDALAAGPLAGQASSPVLLTRTDENPATIAWMTPHRADLSRAWTLGGSAAIDPAFTPDLWRALSVP